MSGEASLLNRKAHASSTTVAATTHPSAGASTVGESAWKGSLEVGAEKIGQC